MLSNGTPRSPKARCSQSSTSAVERFPGNRAWTSSASATAMPSSATRWLEYRRGRSLDLLVIQIGLRQAQDGAALEAKASSKDFLVDKLGTRTTQTRPSGSCATWSGVWSMRNRASRAASWRGWTRPFRRRACRSTMIGKLLEEGAGRQGGGRNHPANPLPADRGPQHKVGW